MSRLMAYFNEVDKNAAVRFAHQMAPLESMSKFGLTTEEQDALMSGEFGRLAGVIGLYVDGVLPVLLVPQSVATTNQLPAMLVPQTVAMANQLPSMLIPQSVAMVNQLPSIMVPQTIGTREQ